MEEFIRSMSIILIRSLAQAEMVEDCLKKKNYELAEVETGNLIKQIGSLIKAFSNEIT